MKGKKEISGLISCDVELTLLCVAVGDALLALLAPPPAEQNDMEGYEGVNRQVKHNNHWL